MGHEEKRYEVGYGRPPKKSRFKKGNPGYSKIMRRMREAQTHKHLTPLQIAAMVLDETISVSAAGKSKKLTKMEALIRSTISEAIKGDKAARKEVMALVPKLTEPPGVEYWVTRMTPEIIDKMDRFLAMSDAYQAEEVAATGRGGRDTQSPRATADAPEEAEIEIKDDRPVGEKRR